MLLYRLLYSILTIIQYTVLYLSFIHLQCSTTSAVLFGWIDSLIALGQRKTLQMEDLWDISRRDDAQKVASRFAYFYSTTNDATAPNGDILKALWRTFGNTFAWA